MRTTPQTKNREVVMIVDEKTLRTFKKITELERTLEFYKIRCDALQSAQRKMRKPERTMVCDILANGHLLHEALCGDRYDVPVDVCE